MKKILFLFLAVVMYSMNTYAQDDCASAVALPNLAGGGTHMETGTAITDGTGGGIGDAGAATPYDAAWFSFAPAADGTINISSCLGGADTRLYVHDNCAGPAIANNDDDCPFAPDGTGNAYASQISGLAVTTGTTYYIEWDDRWTGGSTWDWTIEYCPNVAPSCATLDMPADGAIDQAQDATLSWTSAGCSDSYDVYLGTDPAALTMVGNVTGTSYDNSGLMLGTTYYWYVNPVNANGTTDCSATVYSFTVLAAACDPPTMVEATGVTATDAMVTWVDGAGCTANKMVTVDPAVTGSPFMVACGAQSLDLTGLLTAGTAYTVTVANDCGASPSADVAFTTPILNPDCASSIALPDLAGGGTHMEMGTIQSGGAGGIGDAAAATPYDAAWFSFTPVEDGTINVNSCLGGADTRLYVHDNCAGPSIANDDDTCPFAPDGSGATYASEVTGVAVTSGMTYYIEWDSRWSTGPFNWELTFTPNCDTPPSNVNVMVDADPTAAMMSWDAVPGTALYQVKYRVRGTTAWTQFATAQTQRLITGLDINKQYQYKIRRQCDSGGWSDYSPITMFPLFYSSNCEIPTGVASIYLDDTRFKVRWDDMGQVKGRVRYREVGTTTWSIKYGLPGNNYAYITGLTPGADYEYRVRVNCNDNEWSPYYNVLFFHSLAGGTPSRVNQLSGVQLFPNPVSDVLNVSYANELGSEMTVEVFDMLGRAVVSEISNDNRVALNVNGLNNGTYVVTVTVDGQQDRKSVV